ncbi:hypothetical protein [Rubrimonas cliftonensis]|uniref:Right handed beta helix region n=1 Tax=Rubrimonas cliftonensis TaxID=89524 RepID=A0A1H4EM55_9RHOB|nr:hypothetical protein [Rubrimonas cliftonensis]SEA85620.1 hypothetical protein SAMN05444370_11480 [Rubrimonas cliftonensis]
MKTIHAAPTKRKIAVDGVLVTAFDLQTAVNRAEPGDVVRLIAGVYRKPVTISFGGAPGAQITVTGPAPREGEAVLDGGREEKDGLEGGFFPTDGDWAFVKMTGASHVTFERLCVRNCWPHAFYIRQCADLAFRDIDAEGGRRLIYARSGRRVPTRGLLLERIKWVQDPERTMWRGETRWREVKQEKGFADKSWFNGGLLESFDIEGDVVIRDCDISHAFNGIRMDIRAEAVTDGPDGPVVKRNRDVRIYRNRFSYIRDNAVEPERGLNGWLIAGNAFYEVHATLSLDAVTIVNLAFVGNAILNVSRPADTSNTGGKIIKFLDVNDAGPVRVSVGFVCAFNSARTRTRYISDAKVKPWTDVNNALERFAATDKDDADLFSKVVWRPGVVGDALTTNDPKHPDANAAQGAPFRRWPRVDPVFAPVALAPGDDAPLGGWDGTLTLSNGAQALTAIAVDVVGPDGTVVGIAAGGAPGWRSAAQLGLLHWLDGHVA